MKFTRSSRSPLPTQYVSALRHFSEYDRIIVINGFSKTYSMTSWRLGYLIASKEVLGNCLKIFQHQFTCIPEFLQIAAAEFINLPESWLPSVTQDLGINLDSFNRQFSSHPYSNIIQTIQPSYGMFVFPRFCIDNFDSDLFSSRLLQQGVAVTPDFLAQMELLYLSP